jgi:hypothetical protein
MKPECGVPAATRNIGSSAFRAAAGIREERHLGRLVAADLHPAVQQCSMPAMPPTSKPAAQ